MHAPLQGTVTKVWFLEFYVMSENMKHSVPIVYERYEIKLHDTIWFS